LLEKFNQAPVGFWKGKIKPVACMAFVVKEKLQKKLKAKQRQQEQTWLLLMAYLSFVVSFYSRFL